MDKENTFRIIAYVIIGIVIIGLLVAAFFPGIFYAFKDSIGFRNSEFGNLDKCKPAAGYSEQEWIEHMGHHPDIYKECLS